MLLRLAYFQQNCYCLCLEFPSPACLAVDLPIQAFSLVKPLEVGSHLGKCTRLSQPHSVLFLFPLPFLSFPSLMSVVSCSLFQCSSFCFFLSSAFLSVGVYALRYPFVIFYACRIRGLLHVATFPQFRCFGLFFLSNCSSYPFCPSVRNVHPSLSLSLCCLKYRRE